MKFRRGNIGKLIISLSLPLLIGFTASWIIEPQLSNWYMALRKPFFTLPNWVFGPVWTILYVLMSASVFLVFRRGSYNPRVQTAIRVYYIQLALNFLWIILFFWLKSPLMALIEILMLWLVIWAMISLFGRISPTAAKLQLPYHIWVSYATLLNIAIWYINK